MLVTVAAFYEPYEAHLLRGRLEAEGITAFITDETYVGNCWTRAIALGGAKVKVHRDLYADAKAIELSCRRGEYRSLLKEAEGDLDDATCPHCGCLDYRKRRPFPRAALSVAAFFGAGIMAPPIGWILRCEGCGQEYPAPHRPLSGQKCLLVAALMVATMLGTWLLSTWFKGHFSCLYYGTCIWSS